MSSGSENVGAFDTKHVNMYSMKLQQQQLECAVLEVPWTTRSFSNQIFAYHGLNLDLPVERGQEFNTLVAILCIIWWKKFTLHTWLT